MKNYLAIAIAATMLSATAMTVTPAVAAPMVAAAHVDQDRREDRRDYRSDRRNDARDHRADRRDDRRDYRQNQRDDRRYRPAPPTQSYYDNRPRGYYGTRPYYSNRGNYHQGQVYGNYRNRSYVTDYRRHGLPPPRAGYRYYQEDNGDIVMVAIATGIIGLIIGSALN